MHLDTTLGEGEGNLAVLLLLSLRFFLSHIMLYQHHFWNCVSPVPRKTCTHIALVIIMHIVTKVCIRMLSLPLHMLHCRNSRTKADPHWLDPAKEGPASPAFFYHIGVNQVLLGSPTGRAWGLQPLPPVAPQTTGMQTRDLRPLSGHLFLGDYPTISISKGSPRWLTAVIITNKITPLKLIKTSKNYISENIFKKGIK